MVGSLQPSLWTTVISTILSVLAELSWAISDDASSWYGLSVSLVTGSTVEIWERVLVIKMELLLWYRWNPHTYTRQYGSRASYTHGWMEKEMPYEYNPFRKVITRVNKNIQTGNHREKYYSRNVRIFWRNVWNILYYGPLCHWRLIAEYVWLKRESRHN